jgi:ribonucleoside-diphosphate reductase alpha chain
MAFQSNLGKSFRNQFAVDVFRQKYLHEGAETWEELCKTLVDDVCGDTWQMSIDERSQLIKYMQDMKFIPGGRYLYYAGRKNKYFNNCYLLRAEEDSREDWASLSWRSESCLATGGGIGADYSIYRPSGSILHGTGGVASGPVSKMIMINEIGRQIMQGGSRRSAIYASLSHKHQDILKLIYAKDWHNMKVAGTDKTIWDLKLADFNYAAPLDMTNISVNYDTEWLLKYWTTGDTGDVFKRNVLQALSTGEPGFSFNFFDREKETLRNALSVEP